MNAVIIRKARIPDKLKPVPIFKREAARPIEADWARITRSEATSGECYILEFLDSRGTELAMFQFDTLQIALDQAHAIAGLETSQWKRCHDLLEAE